jgi:hypothetical protein
MKFLIITTLFYFYRYLSKNNILVSKSSNTYLNSKKTSGNDERYKINETEIDIQIYNLRQNFEKKSILDILQSKNISINIKLDVLKDNSFKPPNLKSGGLFNDFDFEFD